MLFKDAADNPMSCTVDCRCFQSWKLAGKSVLA